MRTFHTRTARFLKVLKNKISSQQQERRKLGEEMGIDPEEQAEERGVQLDELFAEKALAFC